MQDPEPSEGARPQPWWAEVEVQHVCSATEDQGILFVRGSSDPPKEVTSEDVTCKDVIWPRAYL